MEKLQNLPPDMSAAPILFEPCVQMPIARTLLSPSVVAAMIPGQLRMRKNCATKKKHKMAMHQVSFSCAGVSRLGMAAGRPREISK